MISDGSKHPLSWYEDEYKTAEVTEDNYQSKYEQGLYIFTAGIIVTESAQNIKFTYTVDGIVREIDDVPVVYDANKLLTVTEFYLATDLDNVDYDTEGWTEETQQTDPINKYLWNYEKTTFSDGEMYKTLPAIIGTYGTSIKEVQEYYKRTATYDKPAIDDSWSRNAPTIDADHPYIWNYQIVVYADDTEDSPHKDVSGVQLIGVYGATGNGIAGVTEKYAASASKTIAPTGDDWKDTPAEAELTKDVRYLWNYEIIAYTDGTSKDTDPAVIGVYGDTGAVIQSITEYYLATDQDEDVTIKTTGWTTKITDAKIDAVNRYLWNYEVCIFNDDTEDSPHRITTEPVLIGAYGETGPAGQDATRAGMYRGVGTYDTNIPANPYEGDYFLDSATGYLYLYSKYNTSTDHWAKLEDYDTYIDYYNSCINDGLQYFKATATPLVKALNAWIQNLVAKTAIIEKLFSQAITLMQDTTSEDETGYIKSKNFVSNTEATEEKPAAGWKVKYDGTAEFNGDLTAKNANFTDINIGGNSVFSGAIHSGPLDLTFDSTAGISASLNSGASFDTCVSALSAAGFLTNTYYGVNSGVSYFGTNKIDSFYYTYSYHQGQFTFKYRIAGSSSYSTRSYTPSSQSGKMLNVDIFINTADDDAYTMKLNNLPTSTPSEAGIVWNDNGTLKIST